MILYKWLSIDLDWSVKIPNVIVNKEFYFQIQIQIHITSENTDVRKLQAWDALREANSARRDPSYGVIGHGSWGQGFEILRQDVNLIDGKVYKIW